MNDLVIVGAGPAGMTAAVYAARKGINPLVLSRDIGGQANWSSSVENYMGFRDIRGSELMDRFEQHMKAQQLRYEECDVQSISRFDGGFEVMCRSGTRHRAKAVIVATGKTPRLLNAPGEEEYRGKGVSYCSTCDGPLFAGVPVAVIGGGNAGLQACFDMLPVAEHVYLVTEEGITADQAVKAKVLGSERLTVYENHKVKQIAGDELVRRIVIADASGSELELSVEGVFVEIGLIPNSKVVDGDVAVNDFGEIIVDCDCHTNVAGLYAAGDVSTAPGKQIIIAAGEGAKAALAAANRLAFS